MSTPKETDADQIDITKCAHRMMDIWICPKTCPEDGESRWCCGECEKKCRWRCSPGIKRDTYWD
jgi:hypothetical protein